MIIGIKHVLLFVLALGELLGEGRSALNPTSSLRSDTIRREGAAQSPGMAPGMAPGKTDTESRTAQIVGTVLEGRNRWNPFDSANDMLPDGSGGFQRTLFLSHRGGRNQDGVYAVRFHLDHEPRLVHKRGQQPGQLVIGENAAFAGNVMFRVAKEGHYTIRFHPQRARYDISPSVEELTEIRSFQVNGFVHDQEGSTECFDGQRTRPAEKWDEWMPSHEFSRQNDGSWQIRLPLSTAGGHEKNGVYQCLFSANHNSDWGYGAILGKPDRLVGGNGYDSRVGHTEECDIVFRVLQNTLHTITVWPEKYRFSITPEVSFFEGRTFQLNGDALPEPWKPSHPSHAMEKGKDGCWNKVLHLSKNGGSLGKGVYTMNFSIDGEWALDSIGFGGLWGRTWHSDPQEWNLLFRVERDGDYTVTFDPFHGRFSFDPPVQPVTRVESVQISGDFEALAQDGSGGWNPQDPSHEMASQDGRLFTKDLVLKEGKSYSYKYSANKAGWAWALVDYPYDGYRRLASHGNPPPLVFLCPRNGLYRFSADVQSGEYSVVMLSPR